MHCFFHIFYTLKAPPRSKLDPSFQRWAPLSAGKASWGRRLMDGRLSTSEGTVCDWRGSEGGPTQPCPLPGHIPCDSKALKAIVKMPPRQEENDTLKLATMSAFH